MRTALRIVPPLAFFVAGIRTALVGMSEGEIDYWSQGVLRDLHRLRREMTAYVKEHRAFPSTLDELSIRVRPDPWGNPYRYSPQESDYRLYSVGLDGVDNEGRHDDIQSAESSNPAIYPELHGRDRQSRYIRAGGVLFLVGLLWIAAGLALNLTPASTDAAKDAARVTPSVRAPGRRKPPVSGKLPHEGKAMDLGGRSWVQGGGQTKGAVGDRRLAPTLAAAPPGSQWGGDTGRQWSIHRSSASGWCSGCSGRVG